MHRILQVTDKDHRVKTRILDAAEILFSQDGFSATSMRAITKKAGVNLAAVNYYFGSKDQLIVEVLSRVIRPLNQRRVELLREIVEKAKPGSPTPEAILGAFARPCLELNFDPNLEQVSKLLEKSLSEKGNFIEKVMEQEWKPIVTRFIEALQTALPGVPHEEIHWRMHFTIGSIVHTACHYRDLVLPTQAAYKFELEPTLRRIIRHSAAGFLDLAERKKESV
jgi:AcrR family transcriptional regulator